MAAAVVVTGSLCLASVGPARAGATGFVNWPAYLDGAGHTSDSTSATAVTTTNAATLAKAWTFLPGAPPVAAQGETIEASPTVYNGVVYVGGDNGTFYALDEATGAIEWQKALGYTTYKGCSTRGITATATVAVDPRTGVATVYVSGGADDLYALNAATGAVVWKSLVARPLSAAQTYYDWSSPTVAGGHVYLGLAASCVNHVRGGLLEYDQSTGGLVHSYYTVPSGEVGGSIWSSAAVAADGDVFVGTGNDVSPTPANAGTSESIVELNGSLGQLGVWQLPLSAQPTDDEDFGASVALFDATLPGTTDPTPLVGACNKNGVFYVLRQSDLAAGPVWQLRIAAVPTADGGAAAACLASAVADHDSLYVAATTTKIGSTTYAGSVREVDAATGRVLWARGLPAEVLGTPSLDGAGVLSVATIGTSSEPSADYLIDAATGAVLTTLDIANSPEFSQPVYADGYLLLATESAGLFAYKLPG